MRKQKWHQRFESHRLHVFHFSFALFVFLQVTPGKTSKKPEALDITSSGTELANSPNPNNGNNLFRLGRVSQGSKMFNLVILLVWIVFNKMFTDQSKTRHHIFSTMHLTFQGFSNGIPTPQQSNNQHNETQPSIAVIPFIFLISTISGFELPKLNSGLSLIRVHYWPWYCQRQ